jgi:N-acetylglucosamine transport system permease protein
MTQATVTETAEAPSVVPTPGRVVGDRSALFDTIAHILLIIWSLLVVLPLLWVLVSSFKTTNEVLGNPLTWPHHFEWQNYATAWNESGIGRFFTNTVIVVGSALVIVMILGAMCSYVLARFRFFGNRFIYYLMLAGLTFPIFLAIVPLFFILQNIGLLNTLPGLIITYVAFALPFTVFFLHAFFRTLPQELYEAAQVDGAGEWRTFFQVMLPMARPGLISVGIFNFLGHWNQYILPIVLIQGQGAENRWVLAQGLTALAVNEGYGGDYSGLFAGMTIAMLPVLIVYLAFQRQLQSGLTAGQMR